MGFRPDHPFGPSTSPHSPPMRLLPRAKLHAAEDEQGSENERNAGERKEQGPIRPSDLRIEHSDAANPVGQNDKKEEAGK